MSCCFSKDIFSYEEYFFILADAYMQNSVVAAHRYNQPEN